MPAIKNRYFRLKRSRPTRPAQVGLLAERDFRLLSSYDVLGSFALIPVGVAFMGPPAEWIGVANTLIGAAVVVVLATMTVIAVSDVRNLRRLEPDAA